MGDVAAWCGIGRVGACDACRGSGSGLLDWVSDLLGALVGTVGGSMSRDGRGDGCAGKALLLTPVVAGLSGSARGGETRGSSGMLIVEISGSSESVFDGLSISSGTQIDGTATAGRTPMFTVGLLAAAA